jgi:hypothetical protein
MGHSPGKRRRSAPPCRRATRGSAVPGVTVSRVAQGAVILGGASAVACCWQNREKGHLKSAQKVRPPSRHRAPAPPRRQRRRRQHRRAARDERCSCSRAGGGRQSLCGAGCQMAPNTRLTRGSGHRCLAPSRRLGATGPSARARRGLAVACTHVGHCCVDIRDSSAMREASRTGRPLQRRCKVWG